MGEAGKPDLIVKARIQQFTQEYSQYIEKNIDTIDAGVPVFFGHLTGAIERTFPHLPVGAHDQILDAVAETVVKTSKKGDDPAHVARIREYSQRMKKCPAGSMVSDVLSSYRLLGQGRYAEVAELLEKYRDIDATIATTIAYCLYTLSAQQIKPGQNASAALPNEMMLAAREHMVELVRVHPPINRLRDTEMIDNETVTRIFWTMIYLGTEWFPQEPGFFRIGISKARKDGDQEIRERLLMTATERFCDDRNFLRELYRFRLDKRDAAGIAGVIRQMTQQYPSEAEPVYYGLRLSIITGKTETYARFRKLAVARNMPPEVLKLLDFAFEVRGGRKSASLALMEDLRQTMGSRNSTVTLLEYVENDAFSEDEARAKRAKKTLFDSIDQYCTNVLKIPVD